MRRPALASPSGRNPPAEAVQVRLLPDALTARSAFGDAATLSRWPEEFDSPTGYWTAPHVWFIFAKLARWWNRQTRGSQKAVPAQA